MCLIPCSCFYLFSLRKSCFWPVCVFRWGQVFILDAVANYIPKDEREAQSICERITPRLAHANSAVVLSSVKVCVNRLRDPVMLSEYVMACYDCDVSVLW
jgi:vesicle coat complex subunit